MCDTNLLVLVFYLLLVLSYTILAFVRTKGRPGQAAKTLITFCFMIFPVFIFLYSLLKLYVYFYDSKVPKK